MDKLMYSPETYAPYLGPEGRVVVVCFCRAGGIFLTRLLEVSGDRDLSMFVIVVLPYPDTISRAGGKGEIDEHVARGDMVRGCVCVRACLCAHFGVSCNCECALIVWCLFVL